MYRIKIDVPFGTDSTIIQTRDQVKNIIDYALTQQGVPLNRQQPARYGFGVIAKPVSTPNSGTHSV